MEKQKCEVAPEKHKHDIRCAFCVRECIHEKTPPKIMKKVGHYPRSRNYIDVIFTNLAI